MVDINEDNLLSAVCQYLETSDLEDCEAVLSRLGSAEEGAGPSSEEVETAELARYRQLI